MFERDPLRDLMFIAAASELAVFIVCMVAVFLRPVSARRADRAMCAWMDRLARRSGRTTIVLIASSLGMCVLLGVLFPVVPRVHDEFSYLLAGDTFAHGRLSNPSPAKPHHFESEHIIVEPVYASKYPPAQGLALAFGWTLGSPVLGVWLTTSCVIGACYWMLRRVDAPAVGGGGGALFGLLSGPMLVWWGHSFWGGSVAAIAGAMLYGSVARLVALPDRDPPWMARGVLLSIVMAISLGVLANSRPYEGLLLSLPVGAWLAWSLVRRIPRRLGVVGIVGPAVVVLALCGWATGAYNRAVTGDPLTPPYRLHATQYGVSPAFLWQERSTPPPYAHRHIEDFHNGWEVAKHRAHGSFGGYLANSFAKLGMFMWFFVGMPLALCNGWLIMHRRTRRALRGIDWSRWAAPAGIATTMLGLMLVTWFSPHYAAPATGVMLLAVVAMMRRFRASDPRARGVPVALLVGRAVSLLVVVPAYAFTMGVSDWSSRRQEMIESLGRNEQRDLVIVRHGAQYTPHENWVYNPADFASTDVLFAWELDTPSNDELLRAYGDRTPWLLTLYRGDRARPPLFEPEVPRLLRYPRLPTMRVTTTPVEAGRVNGLVVTDLDVDGREDLVASVEGRQGLWVLDDGKPVRRVPFRGRPSHVIATDGAWGASGGLIATIPHAGLVHFVERAGGDTSVRTLALGGRPRYASLADLDGDGRQEVLVACPEGGVIAMIDPRSDPVRVIGMMPASVDGARPWAVEGADIDGDGRSEAVVIERVTTDAGAPGAVLSVRGPDGASIGPTRRFEDPTALYVVDLDSDGLDEVIVADAATDLVSVLRSDGNGLTGCVSHQVGVQPMALLAHDVDGDGVIDVVVGTRYGHGLFVLRGGGDGAAAPITLLRRTWFVDKTTAMAMTSDGDLLACTPGALHRVQPVGEVER